MQKFSILTAGCKVNQYESRQICQFLAQSGLAQVEDTERPDMVVVNTCCVTQTASAKSRRLIHQAQRRHPTVVVVCGCLPAVGGDELRIDGEGVHVVRDRDDLASTLRVLVTGAPTTPDSARPNGVRPAACACLTHDLIKAHNDAKVKRKRDLDSSDDLPQPACFPHKTRAFLKVQDGCDASCTYCIIPLARPKVRSRPLDEIVAQAKAFVEAGHKEIVLTGVHVGAYGLPSVRNRPHVAPHGIVGAPPRGCPRQAQGPAPTEGTALPDLLDRVAQVPGLHRIRLSSLDPADVTARLMEVFLANPNIMPHLHLSLQSGSDNVLRRMARPYSAAEFLAKVELIRSHLDRPAITTDIIVGFPGESDADFDETVRLATDVGFAKMHVFVFSARQGTAAARMKEKVPSEVKKERSRILRDLDAKLQTQFRSQFLGETAQVLIETTTSHPSGRAERYFTVRIKPDPERTDATQTPHKNAILTVTLTQDTPDGLLGTLYQTQPAVI
jgi:threonylcarbamoyladenosine tRNA methylthiotransferase MtaB